MSRSYGQGALLLISMVVLGIASLIGYDYFSSFGDTGSLLAYHSLGTFIGGAILLGAAMYFALRRESQEIPGQRLVRWGVNNWCRRAGTFIIAMIFLSVLVNILTIQNSSIVVTFIAVLQVVSATFAWVAGPLLSQIPWGAMRYPRS